MFLRSTGARIWERGEPSPEPYIACYAPRRLIGQKGKGGYQKKLKTLFLFLGIRIYA